LTKTFLSERNLQETVFLEEYAMTATSKPNPTRRNISRRSKVAEFSLLFNGLCPIYRLTDPSVSRIVERFDVFTLTKANVWVALESLTIPQLLTLVLLTVIDVALFIAALAWHRHKKKEEKKKRLSAAS
jgi:hypothetical protein